MDENVSFTIYQPDEKKFHLTPDWIVYGLWFTMIFFFWAFDNVVPPTETIGTLILVTVMVVSIYYIISKFWTYEPLNGTLNGVIEFNETGIKINGQFFKLTDINSLDFEFYDFHGKRSTNGRSFNPMLYQGVNNYVTFDNKVGVTYLTYFKLETEHQYQSLSPFINHAIKLKKMTFKRGIDLLGIENISIEP